MKKASPLAILAFFLLAFPAIASVGAPVDTSNTSTAISTQEDPAAPAPLFFEAGGEILRSSCYMMRICPNYNPTESERVSCTGFQCSWGDNWVECDYQRYYCRCCNADCTVFCPGDF